MNEENKLEELANFMDEQIEKLKQIKIDLKLNSIIFDNCIESTDLDIEILKELNKYHISSIKNKPTKYRG